MPSERPEENRHSEAELRADAKRVSEILERELPEGVGFAAFLLPFGSQTNVLYMSNVARPSALDAIAGWVIPQLAERAGVPPGARFGGVIDGAAYDGKMPGTACGEPRCRIGEAFCAGDRCAQDGARGTMVGVVFERGSGVTHAVRGQSGGPACGAAAALGLPMRGTVAVFHFRAMLGACKACVRALAGEGNAAC